MLTDELLIEKIKNLIESGVGWGKSDDWTNQDFISLSEKIQEQTDAAISHVTLKRIWGKVRYESLPNMHTLNTLAQFAGFENWRSFKNLNNPTDSASVIQPPEVKPENVPVITSASKNRFLMPVIAVALLITLAVIVSFMYINETKVDPDDFSFSSKKVISTGVPNSVVFDYDASKAGEDSVIIQQSWDKKLRAKVSKQKHQHTSIYYFPDFFRAKLIVNDQVVKEHDLFITSDGWLPIVVHKPVPVYFKKEEAVREGKMRLSPEQLQSRNIEMQPDVPIVVYSNVRDFGEIYTDDFVFETALKNDYREGSSACQKINIYLLCECDGTAVGIPLSAKGCISDIELLFPGFYFSGKQHDLSAFGVSFDDLVRVRIESQNGQTKVFINDSLSYHLKDPVLKAKIIGIDFVFEGTGSVDYVKLSNGKAGYEESF